MYVLGPLPGAALTVCLVTCGDTACIGVNVDASAVADLDAARGECLAEEVAAFGWSERADAEAVRSGRRSRASGSPRPPRC